MSPLPRLNGVIRALESGQHAFALFAPIAAAILTQAAQIVA